MGRPLGSQNKDKPFRDALRQAIIDASNAPNPRRRLYNVAEALLTKAEDGDVAAVREVADRLDGKVPQAIENGDGGAFVLTWLPAADGAK